MPRTVYSHCHYCMCQCGTKITAEDNRVLSIEPDRENPYRWRDFCRKGMTAAEFVEHPRRILSPMRRVGDRYEPATYEQAITEIAAQLNRIIEQHGPDAIGSYSGNPLGFSFSASMFWNGLLDALGTGNRYWVGSVDQNNTHVVQEAMYGSEILALAPDIDDCKCFLLVGMDPVQSAFVWLVSVPEGWNRVLAARARGAEIIVVDPRRSGTAERADTHIAIRPGQDWAFLLGLLRVIFEERLDHASERVPLSGVDEIRSLALGASLEDLADRCGIPEDAIRDVARRFANAPSAMCMVQTGVAHTPTGTLADWLGHVLNAITNRLDQPGGRRFERGYMDLAEVFSRFAPPAKHRTRLRDQPTIAGFHSLVELPDEITTPGEGQIRAMLIAGGNPVVSGPDGATLDSALSKLELLVAVDMVQRESHRHAHWLIPGTHFLEREGLHVLTACLVDEPFAQYAPRAVNPPPGVREEWEFFVDLALATGRPLFGYRGVNTLVRWSRWLAKLARRPGWAMNPQWLERALVAGGKRLKYDEIRKHPHGWRYAEKRYGDLAGALRTSDKTVHCAPPKFLFTLSRQLADRTERTSPGFPMLLVNRRSRESMNSMLNETPSLFEQNRSNSVEIHPEDAAALGLEDGQWAVVTSSIGSIQLPIAIVDGGRRGVVTIAHGWGSRIFDPMNGAEPLIFGVNRNLLIDRDHIDPLSQTPSLNATPVRVEPVMHGKAGFAGPQRPAAEA
jgi:formate dehydrogenase